MKRGKRSTSQLKRSSRPKMEQKLKKRKTGTEEDQITLSKIFPQDIMLEILSWLPVKSLVRFKCVSKSWLKLFTDLVFVSMHMNRSKENTKLMVTDSSAKGLYSIEYQESNQLVAVKSPIYKDCKKILGSWNGLVCVSTETFYQMYIGNPSTREYKEVLPRFVEFPVSAYGFGYDWKNNDYVIVMLSCCISKGSTRVYAYSLRKSTWTRIIADIPYISFHGKSGELVNGNLHWVVTDDAIITTVIAYDIIDAMFREVLLPDHIHGSHNIKVAEFRGELSVFTFVDKAEVWVMKNYGVKESWTKLFNIDQLKHGGFRRLTPVCLTKNGLILAIWGGIMLSIFDPKKERLRTCYISGITIPEAKSYVGSIVGLGL